MKYYLAHPYNSRVDMRQWELSVECRLEIEIVNPFYDLQRPSVDAGNGRVYFEDASDVVTRDVSAIAGCDSMIAIIDGNESYGTIMEMVYAKKMDKPVLLVCTNGKEDHYWLKHHSDVVFKSLEELEEYLDGI